MKSSAIASRSSAMLLLQNVVSAMNKAGHSFPVAARPCRVYVSGWGDFVNLHQSVHIEDVERFPVNDADKIPNLREGGPFSHNNVFGRYMLIQLAPILHDPINKNGPIIFDPANLADAPNFECVPERIVTCNDPNSVPSLNL